MRSFKAILAAGAAAVIALSTFAGAGAFISTTSGSVIRLSPAPRFVTINALENATSAFAFDEVQGRTLSAPVAIDAVNPGTYSVFPSGAATIPTGSVVDSHMIHSDPPAGMTKARRTGSVTFPDIILGVIGSTTKLAQSDTTLGAPGTTYAGGMQWRGLEGRENGKSKIPDSVTISPDRRTISFDERTFVMDEFRVVTRHKDPLTISIADSPDTVTVGNDVQYTVTVTNTALTPIANVHIVDTLPAGTTLVTAAAPGGCSGFGPVNCTLGTLGGAATAQATLVVTSPSTVPSGGTITDTAVTSPGNVQASQTTTVEAPQTGVSKGFVLPGDSISISGANPATLSLPNSGPGAPVMITQGDGAFCNGPCAGPATTISPFTGYPDPNHPIHLTLSFAFPDSSTSLTDGATAFGSTIWKNIDPSQPNVGTIVPYCAALGSGVAVPHPCVDGRSITQPSPNSFLVTFEIVYISGDPKFARK